MLYRDSTLTFRDIECVSASGCETRTITLAVRNITAAAAVDGADLRLYPALWNAHDHLEFNLYPHFGNPPYANAYEWGLHITKRQRDPRINQIRKVPERSRYYWGALKNILSATPYVLHHGDTPAYILAADFPVTVIPGHGSPHSLRFENNLIGKSMEGSIRSIHLAEGTDPEAQCELAQLDVMGLLDRNTGIVHGVGLTERDIELMQERRASFIWCPSSNEFLFRTHAPVENIYKLGLPVMLGTDSTLTGSDGMLSELRAAANIYNDPRALFDSATESLKRWVTPVMSAKEDSYFLVRKKTDNPFADFVNLHRSDVLLVTHNGKVLMHDPASIDIQLAIRTKVSVDGESRMVGGDWGIVLRDASKMLGEEFMGGIAPC